MLDCHMHCSHSVDSETPIEIMIEAAIAKGMKYIAFSDHLNRDYLYGKFDSLDKEQLDIPFHIADVARVKQIYKHKIEIACGIECGFTKEAENDYVQLLCGQQFDVILNSVHTVCGWDCYLQEYFEGKSKKQAYEDYLLAVLDSVDAKFDYDVIAHFAFVARKASYEDRELKFEDFPDIIDTILKKIIQKGVSLELNSQNKGIASPFIPGISIVDRYIELGGKEFTFGSDSHRVDRVNDKFEFVKEYLTSNNQKYLNIYKNRQKIKMDLTKL